MNTINNIGNQVQSIPLFGVATDYFNDSMEEHFGTDPFYVKVPKKSPAELKPDEKMEYDEVRRRAPEYVSDEQKRLWKQVMKRAWYHDRNFCGCTPIDCGCGCISIVSIIPLIGAIITYKMHWKLINTARKAGCPAKVLSKMGAEVAFDSALQLIPILGTFFSWMKASSTRNAWLFDSWLRSESEKNRQRLVAQQKQERAINQPVAAAPGRNDRPQPAPPKSQPPRTKPASQPLAQTLKSAPQSQSMPSQGQQRAPQQRPAQGRPAQGKHVQSPQSHQQPPQSCQKPPQSYQPPPQYANPYAPSSQSMPRRGPEQQDRVRPPPAGMYHHPQQTPPGQNGPPLRYGGYNVAQGPNYNY